jgi:uncharacterized ubiquitin-like protein YukD
VLTALYEGEIDFSIKIIAKATNISSSKECKVINMQKNLDMTIADVKLSIKEEQGIPVKQQQLIYAGKELQNDKSLREYHIEDGDVLSLIT